MTRLESLQYVVNFPIFLIPRFSDFPIFLISRFRRFPYFADSSISPILRFFPIPRFFRFADYPILPIPLLRWFHDFADSCIFSIPQFPWFADFADSPILLSKFDRSSDWIQADQKICRRRTEMPIFGIRNIHPGFWLFFSLKAMIWFIFALGRVYRNLGDLNKAPDAKEIVRFLLSLNRFWNVQVIFNEEWSELADDWSIRNRLKSYYFWITTWIDTAAFP